MATATAQNQYYIPHGSHWPIVATVGVATTMVGGATWLNGADYGRYVLIAGVVITVFMMFGWFGTVIRESESGLYNEQVDGSFRWGMMWFIFSEVMFFAAFSALCFTRVTTRCPGWAAKDMAYRTTSSSGRVSSRCGRKPPTGRPISGVITRLCHRGACRRSIR